MCSNNENSQAPLLFDENNDPVQDKTYGTFESEPTEKDNKSPLTQSHYTTQNLLYLFFLYTLNVYIHRFVNITGLLDPRFK